MTTEAEAETADLTADPVILDGQCEACAHQQNTLWGRARRAATILAGAHPTDLDVPCTQCGAEPGAPCPGKAVHGPRVERRLAAEVRLHLLTMNLADAAHDAVAGDLSAQRWAEAGARRRHRELCRLAEGRSYALPDAAEVLALAERLDGAEARPQRVATAPATAGR